MFRLTTVLIGIKMVPEELFNNLQINNFTKLLVILLNALTRKIYILKAIY